MASQEEWFNKLKSWVPTWFFREETNNVAIFEGIAKVLSEIDAKAAIKQKYGSEVMEAAFHKVAP